MPRTPLPMPLGSYQAESQTSSIQRVINWRPVVMQKGALNNINLLQPSGISQVIDTELGACRGAHVMNEVPYFVLGTSLVSLSEDGSVTHHGEITGTVRVSMASNNPAFDSPSLVVVVPGGDAFVFDEGLQTITKITDVDFKVSDTVVFVFNYFVFTSSDGKFIFNSNLNQPLVFDGVDFGAAEKNNDRIVTQIVDHNELSVIGSETTEVFGDSGRIDTPLQSIPGALTEKGAHSKYGAVKFDNTYLFIGGGENELTAIWRQSSSSSAVKVSDDATDFAIQQFNEDEIAQAFAMTFSEKGQFFAIFTFNSARIPSRTFIYNGTASALSGTSVWFEAQTGLTDNSWRVNAIVKANGKLYVGDAIDGRIGLLDDSVLTEYGDTIMRQAAFKPFTQDGTTIFAGELEATFQAGVGLTTGQGSDPVVIYDYTDNNRTWSNEFKRDIGKIGEYGLETVWRRQGRFPNFRTIRLTVTDPVIANLIRVAATPELGVD